MPDLNRLRADRSGAAVDVVKQKRFCLVKYPVRPHSSVDRALASGAKDPCSSHGGGTEETIRHSRIV